MTQFVAATPRLELTGDENSDMRTATLTLRANKVRKVRKLSLIFKSPLFGCSSAVLSVYSRKLSALLFESRKPKAETYINAKS